MDSLLQPFEGKPLSLLSVDQRILLAQALWDSVHDEVLHAPLSEAEKKELDRRLQLFEEGKMEARPWEEVRQEIFGKDGA